MGYVTKTISVYEDDWNYLQSLRVNISSEVRDYLKQLRCIKDGNAEGINVVLEETKLQRNVQKVSDLQLDIKRSEELIKQYNEIEQAKKEQKLAEQREKVEQMKKCPACGDMLPEDDKLITEIKDGVFVHRICFLSGGANDIKTKEDDKDGLQVSNNKRKGL